MVEATYEEYKTATRFAQFKFKYGLFVLIACWICLIILIVFIFIYATELSSHPMLYAIDKMDITDCYCNGDQVRYYINSTSIMYTEQLPINLPFDW